MTTVASVSMSPKAPSSTRSEKPVSIRGWWERSVSAAWPTRGMRKKSATVSTSVAADAPTASPRRSRPSAPTPSSERSPTRSDSVATW